MPKKPIPPEPQCLRLNLPAKGLKIGCSYGNCEVSLYFQDPNKITTGDTIAFSVPWRPGARGSAERVGSALYALAWLSGHWYNLDSIRSDVFRVEGRMCNYSDQRNFHVHRIGHLFEDRWLDSNKYPYLKYPYCHDVPDAQDP